MRKPLRHDRRFYETIDGVRGCRQPHPAKAGGLITEIGVPGWWVHVACCPRRRSKWVQATPGHRTGWPMPSLATLAAVLTDGLSVRRIAVLSPVATCGSPARVSPSPGCSLLWVEPSERLRLETQTQCGPFQKESCKAGVLMVAVSMYTCALAASCSCCQAKGRGMERL